jgi:XTP/dITP diphosphohydrolase
LKVILATQNQGKVREFSALLSELGWTITSLPDSAPIVVEDGTTFEENARKKAEETARALQLPVLADDSGLEVDALGDRPGVYSARYAGESATDQDNNNKLLKELAGVEDSKRTARFVCVLAFAVPGSETLLVRGECEGVLLKELRGEGGFGYDPLFYVPELGKTFAELSSEEKNRISHRAKALRSLLSLLVERDAR